MERWKNRKINRFDDDEEIEIPKHILEKIITENKKLKEERQIKKKSDQGEKKQEKRDRHKINKPSELEIENFIKECRKSAVNKTKETKQTKITEFLVKQKVKENTKNREQK